MGFCPYYDKQCPHNDECELWGTGCPMKAGGNDADFNELIVGPTPDAYNKILYTEEPPTPNAWNQVKQEAGTGWRKLLYV